jgi:RNA polymerase sigma factor (TIGR02999 family)
MPPPTCCSPIDSNSVPIHVAGFLTAAPRAPCCGYNRVTRRQLIKGTCRMSDDADLTRMLRAWSAGDASIGDQLLRLIYDELRKISAAQLRGNNIPLTLQATELVNEAWIRLSSQRKADWNDRVHFFALASTTIRRILLDHARKRFAQRRDRRQEVRFDDQPGLLSHDRARELIDLDRALDRLGELDERQARLVELRYFGGLSVEETAKVLELSPATVKREWQVARAWLYRQLAT